MASSVTVNVPLCGPKAWGVKVRFIVQLAPAGRLVPQLLVWAKGGLAMMELMISVPLVLSVTGRGWLVAPKPSEPKLRLGGDKVAVRMPVPESVTVCGLPVASSVTVNVPLCGPRACGVKVALMVQLPPAGRAVPQLLVCANGPLATMELMISVPAVLSITGSDWLVVPNAWEPKFRLGGSKVTVKLPVPESAML